MGARAGPSVDEERISYEMLLDLVRQERRTNKLVPLVGQFWPQLKEFLDELVAEFREEQGKDPFSRKVMLLTDEVKNARHAGDNLWRLRERKLAMLALSRPKDRKPPTGTTLQEGKLFHAIMDTLNATQVAVFAEHAGSAKAARPRAAIAASQQATPAPQAAPSEPPAETDAEAAAGNNLPADAREPEAPEVQPEPPAAAEPAEPAIVPADTPDANLVTIRALGDIPPFVGPDMETYILKSGDMASVPEDIAKLLVRREKAALVSME